ncbi:MAG: SIMPL domain-containing protein [Gammaproteobacteria bacterium]|jgi:predicted secreted protein
MIRTAARLALLFALIAPFTTATAAESHTYDRVSLSAQASGTVPNDVLIATLHAEKQAKDSAQAAAEVNRDILWALKAAKKTAGIRAQTLGYSTAPVYKDETLMAWRVRQGLRLESHDPAKLSALLGNLQQRVALDGLGYQVSPASRTAAENHLIDEALKAFNTRAGLITKAMGHTSYRIVQIDVRTGSIPRPMVMRSMAAEKNLPAPALEAGDTPINVTIQGTIQLEPPH